MHSTSFKYRTYIIARVKIFIRYVHITLYIPDLFKNPGFRSRETVSSQALIEHHGDCY